jgi:hypothetical protein
MKATSTQTTPDFTLSWRRVLVFFALTTLTSVLYLTVSPSALSIYNVIGCQVTTAALVRLVIHYSVTFGPAVRQHFFIQKPI